MYFLCFRFLPPLSFWPGHCQKFTAVHLSPHWTGLASRQRILVYMPVLLQKHPSKQGDTVGFQCTEPKCESMCLCVCVLVCPVSAGCLFSVPTISDRSVYWGNRDSLPNTGHWVFPAQSLCWWLVPWEQLAQEELQCHVRDMGKVTSKWAKIFLRSSGVIFDWNSFLRSVFDLNLLNLWWSVVLGGLGFFYFIWRHYIWTKSFRFFI